MGLPQFEFDLKDEFLSSTQLVINFAVELSHIYFQELIVQLTVIDIYCYTEHYIVHPRPIMTS